MNINKNFGEDILKKGTANKRKARPYKFSLAGAGNKLIPLFSITLGGLLGVASALKNTSAQEQYEVMSMTAPNMENLGQHVSMPVNHLGSQGISLALFEGRHRKLF